MVKICLGRRKSEVSLNISIMQFLCVTTREEILHLFFQKSVKFPLKWGSSKNKVCVYPSFTKEILKKRKVFTKAQSLN